MSVSASQVRELRDKTNAGMMDCKKALTETNGDFEAAVDWLRKKGLAAAAKKADRVAAEGLVSVARDGHKVASVIEINSETDFVARNDKFQELVSSVAQASLNASSLESLQNCIHPSGKTVEAEIKEKSAIIGEHLTLRRHAIVRVDNGVVATYVHNAVIPNMGKIAVAVALESETDKIDELSALGKSLAMHIAAARPMVLNEEDMPHELVERERAICFDKAQASGKPENIVKGMVEGGVRKFLQENVLVHQLYIMDGKTKISDLLLQQSANLGSKVAISSYVRFELGEGIEVKTSDFAAEVASIASK